MSTAVKAGESITLEAAQKSFTTRDGKGIQALSPTDLEIEAGTFVSVLGPAAAASPR